MTSPTPTPEEQVPFLRDVQRLLAEGLVTASYKFALIRALADLAVLNGEDSGAPREIDTKDIAGKFVELYWREEGLAAPQPGMEELLRRLTCGVTASLARGAGAVRRHGQRPGGRTGPGPQRPGVRAERGVRPFGEQRVRGAVGDKKEVG